MDEEPKELFLTEDEERLVAAIPVEEIARIDRALLANADLYFRKVAYIVGLVIKDFPGIPDLFFARRIDKLVESGSLEARGNVLKMRFSEVRLPSDQLSKTEKLK